MFTNLSISLRIVLEKLQISILSGPYVSTSRVLNSFENAGLARDNTRGGRRSIMRGSSAWAEGHAGTLRSEAGAMRTELCSAWGCAGSEGHVQRRAHVLKGVYEVNHLVGVYAIVRCPREEPEQA